MIKNPPANEGATGGTGSGKIPWRSKWQPTPWVGSPWRIPWSEEPGRLQFMRSQKDTTEHA